MTGVQTCALPISTFLESGEAALDALFTSARKKIITIENKDKEKIVEIGRASCRERG